MKATPVYLEVGQKRVFACSVDWPGWARSGKTEELALEALAAYVPRYAVVAKVAGIGFPNTMVDSLDVTERVAGSATTDFGAPGAVPTGDFSSVDRAEAVRMASLVAAAWSVFDDVVAGAPAELRKGPRGGGRDRDKIVKHVLEAEISYIRKVGIKHQMPSIEDRATFDAIRKQVANTLRDPSDGSALVPNGWPQRYAARRIAWHVLDHAWEIEDRSDPLG